MRLLVDLALRTAARERRLLTDERHFRAQKSNIMLANMNIVNNLNIPNYVHLTKSLH